MTNQSEEQKHARAAVEAGYQTQAWYIALCKEKGWETDDAPNVGDGGPAFPAMRKDPWGNYLMLGGMSLRDAIAIKAMHAEIVTCGVPGPAADALLAAAEKAGRDPEDHIAFNAYVWADAMLKARVQKGGQS